MQFTRTPEALVEFMDIGVLYVTAHTDRAHSLDSTERAAIDEIPNGLPAVANVATTPAGLIYHPWASKSVSLRAGDGESGMHLSGQNRFDPPASW
jgi:hypothetical protein